MATGTDSLTARGGPRANVATGVLVGAGVGAALVALLWVFGTVVARPPQSLPATSVAAWTVLGAALGTVTIIRRASVAASSLAVLVVAAVFGWVTSWAPLEAVANFPGSWITVGVLAAVVVGRAAR